MTLVDVVQNGGGGVAESVGQGRREVSGAPMEIGLEERRNVELTGTGNPYSLEDNLTFAQGNGLCSSRATD